MSWIENAPRCQVQKVIEALEELSDMEMQRHLWNTVEPMSFTEAVESLWDDSGLADELEHGRTGLGTRAETLLTSLGKALKQVRSNRTPNEIIDDPAMGVVRKLAKEALALLRERRESLM